MTERPSRVVFDTNVLVSALGWPDSVPGIVFRFLALNYPILRSEATFAELTAVLMRKKMAAVASEASRLKFLEDFALLALPVDTVIPVQVCRDPRDDKFLALAVSGGANLLITGDNDLLELHPFHGIDILTPRDFLAREDDLTKR